MENKDPFFDNFRKNAQQFEQAPSSDAWTKLSSRLDKHERPAARRRTLPGFGILSVAASLLLLVGVVFTISQTVLKTNVSPGFTESKAVPRPMEDLPLLASSEVVASPQMVEYQRKINANPRGVIKEGGDHKKLIAQSINKKRSPAVKANVAKLLEDITIKDFNWILGTWKSKTDEGTTTEIWTSVNAKFLLGTGNFVNADDASVFSEKMAIREVDGKIYFEAVTQSAGEKVMYELTEINGRQHVFSNSSINFPTHVVIVRDTNGGFTIIFKNDPPATVPDNSILLKNKINSVKAKEIRRGLDRKL